MQMICSRCGSSVILSDLPVVSNVDNFSSVPISILTYKNPERRGFKTPVPHRLLARVCGNCGFADLYVEDPQGLAASVNPASSSV